MVMMSAAALATLAMSMAVVSKSRSEEQSDAKQEMAALYAAEAALAEAVFAMETGNSGAIQSSSYSGAQYWVDTKAETATVTGLTATANFGNATARVEMQVDQVVDSKWQYGAFGDIGLTMDSNAHVDSYDSGAGTYASQAVNSNGNDTWANTNGHVGSNQDITLLQNSAVKGNATPGPSGTATVTGNATVSGSTVSSTTTVSLPAISIPSGFPNQGSLSVTGSQTLAPGDYEFDELRINSSKDLTIVGPARVIATDMILRSNSELAIDATNGPVEFYVRDDFILDSNSLIASGTQAPEDVTFNLLSDNIIDPNVSVDVDYIDFNSNSKLYGTIYAPSAKIEVNSNFELFGAVVAKQVHLDSNAYIHFDEALLKVNSTNGAITFAQVGWRLLSDKD